MKWVVRSILGLVALVVVAVVIAYFALNSIVRATVERQASASLAVPTTLGAADLSIFGGKVALNDLEVGSPKDFTAAHIFTLGGVNVAVHYGQLTAAPIHISEVDIDNPVLVIEVSKLLKLNLQALMDGIPETPQTSGGQPAQPIQVIIDKLVLTNAQVTFLAGMPGLDKPMTVTIPSLTLTNIGNADGSNNGAGIKDVLMQTMTALAGQAGDQAHLPALKDFLSGKLGGLAQQLGGNFTQQFQGVAGSLGQTLGGKGGTNGNGAVQDLKGLLGGKK